MTLVRRLYAGAFDIADFHSLSLWYFGNQFFGPRALNVIVFNAVANELWDWMRDNCERCQLVLRNKRIRGFSY